MPRPLRRLFAASSLTLLVGLTAESMPWSTDMVRQPSVATASGPRAPQKGTVPLGGALPLERWQIEQMFHNPLVGSGPSPAGRALFLAHCSPCHGDEGRGNGAVARVFVQPRDLTDPALQSRADSWLYATITNGGNTMPRYGPELATRERWEVATYVKSLKASAR